MCLLFSALCFNSSSFKHVASRKVNPRKSTRAASLVPLFVDCYHTLFQTVKQSENFQDNQCLGKIWGEQEIWVDELVMFLPLWALLLSSPYWRGCLIFKLLQSSPFCLLKQHMFSCWKHLWEKWLLCGLTSMSWGVFYSLHHFQSLLIDLMSFWQYVTKSFYFLFFGWQNR